MRFKFSLGNHTYQLYPRYVRSPKEWWIFPALIHTYDTSPLSNGWETTLDQEEGLNLCQQDREYWWKRTWHCLWLRRGFAFSVEYRTVFRR